MSFSPTKSRAQFPALSSNAIFLDNPGGTQVPQSVIDAVSYYYTHQNANLGGAFRTSRSSESVMSDARQAAADLLDAQPNEIVFGQNMTTLTFNLARSLASRFRPGDEIVVTRLDHDANISPWTTLARDTGATIKHLDFDPTDCTLRLDQLDELIGERTKLVAIGWASNAVGTINPVAEVCAKAKAVGALSFVDAVQYAPHCSISVSDIDCDFLACSAYKFFGPHVGILWGRHSLLEELEAYKVRPAKDSAPDKFETGTLNHEGIAGTTAAINYLAGLASTTGTATSDRRSRLVESFGVMQKYEQDLCNILIKTLRANPAITVYGITDPDRATERVPTVSITVEGHTPRAVAEALGDQDIFVWDGHYYAVDVVDQLGLTGSGGMVRIGLAHYNTEQEVRRLGEAFLRITP